MRNFYNWDSSGPIATLKAQKYELVKLKNQGSLFLATYEADNSQYFEF